jgi:hypothetical protein
MHEQDLDLISIELLLVELITGTPSLCIGRKTNEGKAEWPTFAITGPSYRQATGVAVSLSQQILRA